MSLKLLVPQTKKVISVISFDNPPRKKEKQLTMLLFFGESENKLNSPQ
ncbi:MAG: hypothetical protein ACTSSG_02420 [Candidatus Heimdallarchaeaceae archaeon]